MTRPEPRYRVDLFPAVVLFLLWDTARYPIRWGHAALDRGWIGAALACFVLATAILAAQVVAVVVVARSIRREPSTSPTDRTP